MKETGDRRQETGDRRKKPGWTIGHWLLAIGYRLSAIVYCLLSISLAGLPLSAFPASSTTDQPTVILVLGAPGNSEFGSNFVHQAAFWEAACTQAGCTHMTLGLTPSSQTNDFELLKNTLATEPKDGLGQLWLVLIGHGTFDGKEARFNLR